MAQLVTVATWNVLEYATRRPANKERISTFNRGVDVPLHLRVYLTLLLRVTLLASRVHQQLLSMQGCVFFCQEDRKDAVHEVCTFSMGEKLQKAVEASNNQTWKVQLSSAISGDDAHAVDVKYHLPCWVKNVQRGATREGEGACTERN